MGNDQPEARLLLIEDDAELCALMVEYFARAGLAADAVHDGRQGLAKALGGDYDLVVLDGMLPALDGVDVLRQLRGQRDTPVIMLTARAAESDRIAGLDAGADDYVPKPFTPAELLARIRAVLRRAGRRNRAEGPVEVGGLRLSPADRRAWLDGQPVALTSLEFDLLLYLVRAAGRAVSREELTAALHQAAPTPFDRSLDVHVSHVRKKLGPAGERIRTVRGVGYQFGPGD